MPIYRHVDKLIHLVHVPKTGGSTVEEVVKAAGAMQAMNTINGSASRPARPSTCTGRSARSSTKWLDGTMISQREYMKRAKGKVGRQMSRSAISEL